MYNIPIIILSNAITKYLYFNRFTFIVNKQSGTSINFDAFAQIFGPISWGLIFTLILGGSLCYLFIRTSEYYMSFDNFMCSMGAVSAAYLSRDCSFVHSETFSFKFAWMTNCLCGFFVFTFYTCDLTATMTAKPPGQQINSFKVLIFSLIADPRNCFIYLFFILQDILDKGYQTLVLKESADSLTMQNSPPGTVLHDIYFQVPA